LQLAGLQRTLGCAGDSRISPGRPVSILSHHRQRCAPTTQRWWLGPGWSGCVSVWSTIFPHRFGRVGRSISPPQRRVASALANKGMKRLAVIGAGAWGSALAIVANRAGTAATLWARNPDIAAAINQRHENPCYLPGVTLDPAIDATADIGTALEAAEAALLAVPAQSLRGVLEEVRDRIPDGLPMLHCAKGIEIRSLVMMSQIGVQLVPSSPFAVLSGPSFAAEVARDLPSAVVIASDDASLATQFRSALGSARFRPYLSRDCVGVEIGGAVKNVFAIACGIVAGRGLGDNARAALITRGLAEMVRFGVAQGAEAETFRGLSGLGDMVLSCTAGQSRNYSLGLALGRDHSLDAVLAGRRTLVEGVATARAVVELADRLEIEMPICAAVDAILQHGASIDATTDRLLRRPYRLE
jgi:glycerol-3-phosphate dehydrogenase (NAD(P)+)